MQNKIFPCLWYDENAKKAAEFYCSIFGGKIVSETEVVVNVDLLGQKIMLLNGGPYFKKNASVSFTVIVYSEEEAQKFWDMLSVNGDVIMEFSSFPWSKMYGMVKDQYDVTWQILLKEMGNEKDQRIIPNLMFLHQNNGSANEAIDFYTNVFPSSTKGKVLKYGDISGNENDEVGNILHASFEIFGYTLFCMDSSSTHQYNFNEGVSMVVMTDDQEETDNLWTSLITKGGTESRCGWLKDRFGLSWQIIPKKLIELMGNPHREKAQRVVEAMMKMKKIVIADLETAYNS